MRVELHFVRKGFPQTPPVLIVKVEGDRSTVEKVIEAVRKAVGEMEELEESSYVTPAR